MQENPYIGKVTRTFQDLQVIFEEGNYGDEMYIVHSGTVNLVKQSSAGEILIATIQPGEFFGEMALVDNAPRSVGAVAGTDQTRLLALDRDKFLFLVSHQPAFCPHHYACSLPAYPGNERATSELEQMQK